MILLFVGDGFSVPDIDLVHFLLGIVSEVFVGFEVSRFFDGFVWFFMVVVAKG